MLRTLLQLVANKFIHILTAFTLFKICYYALNVIYLQLSPFPFLKEEFSDSNIFPVASQL
jgi:hypothetical protein